MSGTSADGVTAVLARFGTGSCEVLKEKTFPFSPALRRRVLEAPRLAAPELSRLNFELGAAFAAAALRVIGRGPRPEVIGSHGQTVWHGPDASPPNTLQLAEPSVIAERTGIPVVADFRPRDMAAGGQGAPLVPAFDEFLYGRGPLRGLQNIGGIANLSVAGGGKLWTAFDTGPGNSLLDTAAAIATGGRLAFDLDGGLARRGQPDESLITRLLSDPFFRKTPPKSLDRGSFSENFLRRNFSPAKGRNYPDILATLTLFTARSIEDSYRRFVLPRWKLSKFWSAAAAPSIPSSWTIFPAYCPHPRPAVSARGMPVMAKEAACFAWLALRAVRGQSNHCPKATGARGARILGKIIPI